ncbi:uncharacterized protein LOC131249365 isoform X2 [Magnolia sinica]|uniref:uncharacterized protein LOC131249365 isoform X2 n=1 Tax=Magnolia sinica TaxID=86752 RepID=UPI002658696E|nr:uncharacterized protein LOC131249365 isoform X2 [Magnolia sinica]
MKRYLQSLSRIASRNPSFSFSSSSPSTSTPWNRSIFAFQSTATAPDSQESRPPIIPTERVSAIVDDISGLTLLEVADLTEILRKKFNVEEMPIMTVMMPGMAYGGTRGGAGGKGGAKAEEKKAEKTAFDLKLEGFDAASKIKIIKEVRTFTDLGLKEAKDLVEKAPTLLKKGVTKEEAVKIIEKMKEVGAKVVMESSMAQHSTWGICIYQQYSHLYSGVSVSQERSLQNSLE